MADGGLSAALIIGGITAAASAGAAYSQAVAQNKAIEEANRSAMDADAAQKAQIEAAAAERKAKLAKQYDLYEGAGRVNAADRSVSAARSTESLQAAALSTALGDQSTIDLNTFLGLNSQSTETAATIYSNQSRRRLTGMDTFIGGLQGLQAGVSLYTGFKSATRE